MIYGGWKQSLAADQQNIKEDDDDEPDQDEARDAEANHHADHEGAGDEEPATAGGSKASRFMARVGPVVRGTGAAARQGVAMARRYPRVSMASGLSAAILGAVVILQPGKGKHDTTAQIPSAPVQTTAPSQTQTALTDPPAPTASAPKADDPAPGPGKKSGTLDGNELPLVAGDPISPDGKGQSNSPGNEDGLLAGVRTEPAAAPDKKGEAPGPLPVGEPVKLTAGEGLVPLPPVSEPLAAPGENQGPGQVVDLAPAPGPAPVLAPVMELAAADVKPGTPPDKAHVPAVTPAPAPVPAVTPAPAPAVAPAPTPVVEKPKAAGSPAPVPVPIPAPSVSTPPPPATAGTAGKAATHTGESGVKEASKAKGTATLGTAAAATIVGALLWVPASLWVP